MDQNKSDLVVVCQGVCSVAILLQKKKIPKQWFKMQTFIISHSFCGSRTGGQLSLVVLAQDLSCRNGQSPPSGTEWEVGCWSSCGLASVFFIGWSQGFSVASHHMDWIMLPHSMTALDFLCGSSGSQTEYFKRERERASLVEAAQLSTSFLCGRSHSITLATLLTPSQNTF